MSASVPDRAGQATPGAADASPPSGDHPSREGLLDLAALPWRDMETAPHDGTIIAVRFHPWRVATNDAKIQFAQWLDVGEGGKFCTPFDPDSEPYADAWLPLELLNICIGGDGE